MIRLYHGPGSFLLAPRPSFCRMRTSDGKAQGESYAGNFLCKCFSGLVTLAFGLSHGCQHGPYRRWVSPPESSRARALAHRATLTQYDLSAKETRSTLVVRTWPAWLTWQLALTPPGAAPGASVNASGVGHRHAIDRRSPSRCHLVVFIAVSSRTRARPLLPHQPSPLCPRPPRLLPSAKASKHMVHICRAAPLPATSL